MTRWPRSPLKRCVTIAMGIVFVAFMGPSVIHFGYRAVTSTTDRHAQTERYHFLATAEVSDKSLSEDQRENLRQERMRLFFWFHARGWNIDEGDEDRSWLHPWRELLQHWTKPNQAAGASKTPVPIAGAALLFMPSVIPTHEPVAALTPRRSPKLRWAISRAFLSPSEWSAGRGLKSAPTTARCRLC